MKWPPRRGRWILACLARCGDREIVIQCPGGARVFPSPNVWSGSGAHLVFCSVDTGSSLPCGRAARLTTLQLIGWRMRVAISPSTAPYAFYGFHRKNILVPSVCWITSTIFTHSSIQVRTSYFTPQVCVFIDFTSYAAVFVMFDCITRFSLTINSPAQPESSHYSCLNIWKKSMLHLPNSRLRSDKCHAWDKAARNIAWRRVFTFGANLKLHIC